MASNIKFEIGQLEGSANWKTWKYKVSLLLRSIPGTLDVIQGKLTKPNPPEAAASTELVSKYETELAKFQSLDSNALLVLTTNMTEETLHKVMRCATSSEMWTELHRLFDGAKEDRSYELCMRFFRFQIEDQDMATHISTLKNLWYDLNKEIEGNDLPDMLLICKILDTLPEQYFNFKSSWLLMNKSERNIENLTTQLCAHERALMNGSKENVGEASVLRIKDKSKQKFNKKKCNYCKEGFHKVTSCKKWIADGKPPKPNPKQPSTNTAMMTGLALACDDKTTDRDSWYVDNGATSHFTNRKDTFQTFENFGESHKVLTANGEVIEAIGKGSIQLEADVYSHKEPITLTNVWYVPSIKRNLFSVLAAQDKLTNSIFESNAESCKMKNDGKVVLIGNRDKNGGLYKLKVKTIMPKLEMNHISTSQDLQLYHERLGHQNKRHVAKLIQRELGVKLSSSSSDICEGCVFGKSHRHKFGERPKATKPGELISTDVCGPFPYSISKCRYYVLFKDSYTKYRWIYFLRHKSEVHACLKDFLAEAKTCGHVVQELLSDNGGEFDNGQVRSTLRQSGIRQRFTMPFTPEQNGGTERENRTVVEMTRAIMHAHDEIPKGLWAEISKASVYILNRTGPTPVDGKSPHELWYGKKPRINHLRIIGSHCYVHVPKQKRSCKLDKKAQTGILIGYDGDEGYRVFDVKNLKLLRSRDIVVDEVPLLEENNTDETSHKPEPEISTYEFPVPSTSSQVDENNHPQASSQVHDNNHPSSQSETNDSVDDLNYESLDEDETDGSNVDENVMIRQDEVVPSAPANQRQLRDRNQIKPPQRFSFDQFINEATSVPEPSSYQEVLKSSEKDKWIEAMNKELTSLEENQTWELTDLPKNRKALPCKWIFKIKRNPDGTVDKYKARLVAVGYNQRKGIDYNQTFSPVAKMSTIRTLLTIAATEGLALRQFDVSTAFLYGSVKEEIFMRQPQGYDDGTNRVCKLKRSLYGLKQAPKCWNECIHDFLIESGFIQSEADACVYIRERGQTKILLGLYVDDGLLAASDEREADNFIQNELKRRFKITTKEPTYFLGLEIEQNNECIKVHQAAYTQKLLEKFGMNDCKPVGTPIVKCGKETDDKENPDDQLDFPYRQAVGSLAYLMVGTRPDIAYAVGVVSRSLDKPTKTNIQQVKRIFRYLKGTVDTGLEYIRKKGEKRLVCYSDADHGGDDTSGCSTSGMLCLYAGAAISWRSTKQAMVALSSTEAEIVAASEASREIVWLKRLLRDLKAKSDTPLLRIDNESAIKLAYNHPSTQHRKTKHIKLKHFYIRQCVSEKEIVIEQVPTEEQLADMFTKPLFKPRLVKLCQAFSLKKARVC